jgi:hypothetical protein
MIATYHAKEAVNLLNQIWWKKFSKPYFF